LGGFEVLIAFGLAMTELSPIPSREKSGPMLLFYQGTVDNRIDQLTGDFRSFSNKPPKWSS
jgi:hypothetical protein